MLDRLDAHRAWANRLYIDWIATLAAPDAYCLKLLSHVIRAEEAWLVRLRGGVPENRIWVPLSVPELAPLSAVHDAELRQALAGDLTRLFRYRRFDGTPMESTAADIVTHLCVHGTYHRAQIASHAAREGLPKTPGTDFIVFARENP